MKIQANEIKLVSVKDLKLKKGNRNKHPKDQLDMLAKHFAYQGFRNPLIVSNQSGEVVCGNGRLMAAKKAGLKELPVIYQDFETPEMEYSYHVADNGLGLWSELDFSGINSDIGDLGPDFDIDMLGLKNFSIDVADKEELCDADEVPEHVEPKAKLGDVYQLGSHRLMCGDSTNLTHIDQLMGLEKADAVFTDPPYGMFLDTDYTKMPTAPNGANPLKHKKVLGDNEDFEPELIQTCLGVFSYVSEVFMFGADYYADLLPDRNKGSWVVWDKRVTENFDKMIGSAFELCWSKKKHKREICRVNNTLFSGESDAKNKVHPTQKPIKVIEWFFNNYLDGKLNVVDLFGGSGSTLIACEKTNRKCFMCELDPHYVSVIIERWMKYTGKMAYLIEDSSGKLKEPVPYAKIDLFQGESAKTESKSIARKSAGQSGDHIEKSNV